MKKNITYWIIALIITLSALCFQNITGPTKPKKLSFELSDRIYSISLPRSLETTITTEEAKGDYDALHKNTHINLSLKNAPDSMLVIISYRKYPSNDEWIKYTASRNQDQFALVIPQLPPAGKLEYSVEFKDGLNSYSIGTIEPIVLRYKSNVPWYYLIPHIFFMFFAFLFSTYTGVVALTKNRKTNLWAILTLLTLIIGGFIFGPLVQKYAFGVYWSGIPFGWDLTDNKTLIALIFWIAVVIRNFIKRKEGERRYYYTIAAIVMIIVFSIPHSLRGSEFNHTTKEVVSGK